MNATGELGRAKKPNKGFTTIEALARNPNHLPLDQ